MVFWEQVIHIIYFVFAAVVCIYFLKHLFKRVKRQGWVYDIVYAYCLIPFLLRVLYIK
ncbi:MAG: hypothetical protein SPD11_11330 [Sphaerochaetaceae bacterium]|nr:hypothetical protein [Sphaerochaetaceae bacterium]